MNEIKDNNMKLIASSSMNLQAITFYDKNIYPIFMNNLFDAEKF